MKILSIILQVVFPVLTWAAVPTFRLHLMSEPGNLDPNKQRTSTSSYLLGNLYRNIYRYENDKGLVPDLGMGCERIKQGPLVCKIKKNLTWNDGTPLTASDFLNTYHKILNPLNDCPRADLLFKIKNAKEIYLGKKKFSSLGITAINQSTLKFEFQESDPDFEYNLAMTVLAPTKDNLAAYSGPYQLKDWKKGRKIIIEPNPKFIEANPQRPSVEFLFIEEDSVALNLYEKNEIHFLRRLPTLFIPAYKNRPDFHFIPIIRFDYLGFGPELAQNPELRKSLSTSLNFDELQKIFSSKGKPGCIGLPDSWFPQKAPCIQYVPKAIRPANKTPPLKMMFSALGGEDHKRAAEWMQLQWQKNIQILTQIEMKENKTFIQALTTTPPAIFRKGVSVDRPTCLAALETFSKQSSENYIKLNEPAFEQIIKRLTLTTNIDEQKKLCLEGVDFLLSNFLLIPTGPIHFSILVRPTFVGWNLNQMNQLDLSYLKYQP